MKNKTVVITGATSGIGQVAAERLAEAGARIVQIARDRRRGDEAMSRLRAISPVVAHRIYYADLSRLKEVNSVATAIAAAEPRIDVLLNNAGAMFSSYQVTEEGLERTFALNHMAYFVLAQGLRKRLIASSPARVINTASDTHRQCALHFGDLQSFEAYRTNLYDWLRHGGGGMRAYCRSKLCNILFTQELARQLSGTGVTVNCFHPGFVATRFGDASGGLLSLKFRLAKLTAVSPAKGADTLVYLASSPEVAGVTGKYFCQCEAILPSEQVADETARRLWRETARLASEIIDVTAPNNQVESKIESTVQAVQAEVVSLGPGGRP